MKCLVPLLMLVLACGDDSTVVPIDSGSDRGGEDAGADATQGDGGTDGGGEDGGTDGATDGATDATRDLNAPELDVPDTPPPTFLEICAGDEEATDCGSCATGFGCTGAFCGGGTECSPASPCSSNDECSGACVLEEDAERGFCEFDDDGDCDADRDCLLGFACEGGSCVDRRIPCSFATTLCPRGYICTFEPTEGAPFCVPALGACETDANCEIGATCADVDGDGDSECMPAGSCSTNDDCADGTSCGVDPNISSAFCVVDGACRSGACPGGFTCATPGSGVERCVAEGGSCSQNSECPAGSICGAVSEGDPLRCLTFDEDE